MALRIETTPSATQVGGPVGVDGPIDWLAFCLTRQLASPPAGTPTMAIIIAPPMLRLLWRTPVLAHFKLN